MREGVTKFNLRFTRGEGIDPQQINDLNGWRELLYRLRLIGQDPSRYGGYGYGNLSCRLPPLNTPVNRRRFLVTGTQTGHLPHLGTAHFAIVTGYDPASNSVEAQGPIPPSSESLTHGTIYDLDSTLRCVMHVHCPEIWEKAAVSGLICSRRDVAYGSPEMASEICRLFSQTRVRDLGLFVMLGHEDGVVSFGRSASEAGCALLRTLAGALRQPPPPAGNSDTVAWRTD